MSTGATSSVSWPASSRASRSRSFTSRSMRSVWRATMSRKRWRSAASDVAFRQGLDVSADRGQRRAELVRHVGDEVAPDPVRTTQVGDVVQHQDGAVRAVRRHRRRARHDGARGVPGRRQLEPCRHPPRQRGRDQGGDRRMPDRLDVVVAQRQPVEPQHAVRGVVGQLQPALRIDHDHPFDHAGEDRLHLRAIARLLCQPPPELLHRAVERARHHAQLVVAVAEPRRPQVAGAVPLRDLRDAVNAAPHPSRDHPGDQRRADQRQAERQQRHVHDRLQLLRGSWSAASPGARTPPAGFCTAAATYSMSIFSVSLRRRDRPTP